LSAQGKNSGGCTAASDNHESSSDRHSHIYCWIIDIA